MHYNVILNWYTLFTKCGKWLRLYGTGGFRSCATWHCVAGSMILLTDCSTLEDERTTVIWNARNHASDKHHIPKTWILSNIAKTAANIASYLKNLQAELCGAGCQTCEAALCVANCNFCWPGKIQNITVCMYRWSVTQAAVMWPAWDEKQNMKTHSADIKGRPTLTLP